MSVIKRALVLSALFGCFLLVAAGCGADCETACSKIYDECRLSFTNTSKAECTQKCETETGQCTYKGANLPCKEARIDCVMDTDCNSMQNCY